MERVSLRPAWIITCTAGALRAAPWSLLPLVVTGTIMTVASSSLPQAQYRPAVFVASLAISWFAAAFAVQGMACGAWRMKGGSRIPAAAAAKTIKGLFLSLLGALMTSFLIMLLGAAALFVGVVPAVAFSLWILCAASLEGLSGRKAADRAWGQAGGAGVLLGCLALVAGALVASYVCLLLSLAVGSSAAAAWPPVLFLVSVPLVASAYIARG